MKFRASVSLLLCALFLLVFSQSVEARESIRSMVVIAKFDPDGSTTVVERIKVNIEHKRIKHGLYRVFPSSKVDGTKLVNYGFAVQSVKLDDKPWRAGNRLYSEKPEYHLEQPRA